MTISKENDPTKRFIFLNVLMQVGIGNPEPQLPAPWLKREMSEKLGVFAPFFWVSTNIESMKLLHKLCKKEAIWQFCVLVDCAEIRHSQTLRELTVISS